MIDLLSIVDSKIHLGDLIVSTVGLLLGYGMRKVVSAIRGVLALADKLEYVADTHTSVLKRISGWRPSRSMYFNPDRNDEDQVFHEPKG